MLKIKKQKKVKIKRRKQAAATPVSRLHTGMVPDYPRFQRRKPRGDGVPILLTLMSVMLIVSILGGAAAAFVWPQLSDMATADVQGECMPRGTPTCDEDGNPIAAAGVKQVYVPELNIQVASVKLSGAAPHGLDFDEKTGKLYVANGGRMSNYCDPSAMPVGRSNTLSVIDPVMRIEMAAIDTETGATWPEVDSKAGLVYVAGNASGMIAKHQLSGQRSGSLKTGGSPYDIGLGQGTLVVTGAGDGGVRSVSGIDSASGDVIKSQTVSGKPRGMVYDKRKHVYYAVSSDQGEIVIINADNGAVQETFNPLAKPSETTMLAFSERTRRLFIADAQNTSSISVINIDTRFKLGEIRFSEGRLPVGAMQVDDQTGMLYAALPSINAVGVADIANYTVLGKIKTEECPFAVRLDVLRGIGAVTNQASSTVSVFQLKDVRGALER